MNIWDACYHGKLNRVVELSDESSFDIDKRNAKGITPLISAIRGGHCDIVEKLLLHRPDTTLPDPDGRTAMDIAAEMERADLSSLLDNYMISVITQFRNN